MQANEALGRQGADERRVLQAGAQDRCKRHKVLLGAGNSGSEACERSP